LNCVDIEGRGLFVIEKLHKEEGKMGLGEEG
jgi:hypothetical protein